MLAPRRTEARIYEDRHPEWVVLLDGIGPNWFQMAWMARPLAAEGFSVVSITYPSAKYDIRTLAEQEVAPCVAQTLPEAAKIHVAALSMGGVLTRAWLQSPRRPSNLGRVVMLAPPNQGSEVSDRLKNWWFYKWNFGPAGQELTTDPQSTPNALGPVDFPCGIIAGTRSFDPWFSWMFGAPNDGKVAVERTKVAGMSDFCTVKATHYDIMRKPEVTRLCAQFLRHGSFRD